LAQVYQEILVDHILKQSAHPVYSEAVRQWPIPPQWARLPSPTNHHRSYSYNQYGHIAQLNPYVLRSCLTDNMITIQASAGIKEEFAAELADISLADVIVRLLSELPKLIHLVFQPSISPEVRNRIHRQAVQFLESYKRFIRACAPVKSCKSYLQRSNLHAVNHVLDTIKDYGTASNVKCSPGEAKHKPFKAFVVRTNNRAIDLQLIRMEMERTAIRFTLDGAFRDTHPTITAMLGRINQVCPQLFIRLSPVSRWIHRIGIDDDEFIGQLGNASAIRVLNKIKEYQLRDHMPSRASPGTWIRTAIMNHYAKSPATALPSSLPAFRLRYYSKVTFLSPATQYLAERVMSFEAGQMFYSTAGAIWCLEAVVVPTIQETRGHTRERGRSDFASADLHSQQQSPACPGMRSAS
jgi:hypothetical protein